MTIEEIKRASEDMEVNDVLAAAEESRDVLLLVAAKLEEIEKRIERVEHRTGKTTGNP
jgi:hypothetical protein